MILRATWVVPVASAPVRDGYVDIDGGVIRAVGAWSERAGRVAPGDEVIDLGSAAITPGLVNPHTHLELTCYAGAIAAAPFWEWIIQLIPLRAAPGQREREAAAVADGARASLRAGVTCVGDISRCGWHWPVLKPLPIRKVCYVELLSLADLPPRTVDELTAAVAEVVEDELLTVGVTPHAPYTVPAADIAASIALARGLGRPWTTHWMETREEVAFVCGETEAPHAFLAALLRQCGVASPRRGSMAVLAECIGDGIDGTASSPGLLAHMNYANDADAEAAARLGLHAVYCPRAHAFFGHGAHPYRRLMERGVGVVLGTDSAASNADASLSMLAEARHVLTQTPDPPPARVLFEMITVRAAAALGLGGRVGALAPGLAADVAAFPLARDVDDPVDALIRTAPAAMRVWVDGRAV